MEGKKRGSAESSLQEAPDVDTVKLLLEIRDLFSEYPALLPMGPEKARRALRLLRDVRADVCAVEAVLEALRVEGEILA